MFNKLLCRKSAFLIPLDITKSHEEQLYTWKSKERMSAENWNVEIFEKFTEKLSVVGLIDLVRILKALIILFLLYICMNYASNQNGKVQEETLAYSNSLYLNSIYFKIILPLFQVFQKPLPIHLSLRHIQ